MKKKLNIRAVYFISAVVWAISWVFLLRILVNFLNNNPNFAGAFSIPVAWFIQFVAFLISFVLIGIALVGKKHHTLVIFRYALSFLFGALAFVNLATAPMCVGINGNLLVTPGNYSCLTGNDSLFAWIFSPIIPYGSEFLFWVVYIGGIIIYSGLFVLIYPKKKFRQRINQEFGGR